MFTRYNLHQFIDDFKAIYTCSKVQLNSFYKSNIQLLSCTKHNLYCTKLHLRVRRTTIAVYGRHCAQDNFKTTRYYGRWVARGVNEETTQPQIFMTEVFPKHATRNTSNYARLQLGMFICFGFLPYY